MATSFLSFFLNLSFLYGPLGGFALISHSRCMGGLEPNPIRARKIFGLLCHMVESDRQLYKASDNSQKY
jgi:hypothetical protein